MTHRDMKGYNETISRDTQIQSMRKYLKRNMGFNGRDARDVADALNIPWTQLVFMPNAIITFKLDHLRPELTIQILEFLKTTYNNRGPDGKNIVASKTYWLDKAQTKFYHE